MAKLNSCRNIPNDNYKGKETLIQFTIEPPDKIYVRGVSCDFVDRGICNRKYDPRIHTKPHEPNPSA
ncbi:MAG TPA: hypothetical protein VJU86_00465 [Pyrinomonadaceae bacterium]|nr:hypothetical protein [Pyrinomonadaceae bacterium]